ncbi:hypothetical protein [Williamsia sp. CHRR-6]|uniref:hypothetical protein n=1 Tax=Williamsia sp. CHRR-6 TaxID=2835871 RepID=UPI001BD9FC81|nr:hypothetical protein [Williamsia sp. CHRR-6]MBT0566965.1 hypothetical protein [Williamsia sp. CHRR-6]
MTQHSRRIRTQLLTLLLSGLIALSGGLFAAPAHAEVDAFAKGSHFFSITNKGETNYYYQVVYADKNNPDIVYHNWEGTASPYKGRILGAWTGGTENDQIDVYLSKDVITLGAVRQRGVTQAIAYHYKIPGNSNICLLDRFLRAMRDYYSTADAGGDGDCTAY